MKPNRVRVEGQIVPQLCGLSVHFQLLSTSGRPDAVIRRIRRGLYDLPRSNPIIGQTAPDIMATVRALMDGSHAQWQFTGAYAANALGLSDQVPAKVIILTDGVPRRVALGKLVLMFRRAAPRNLLGAGTRAGLVIQALRYLHGSPDMPKHIAKLRKDLDARTKEDLAALTPKLPAWMRPLAQQITALGPRPLQDRSGTRSPRRIDTAALAVESGRNEGERLHYGRSMAGMTP